MMKRSLHASVRLVLPAVLFVVGGALVAQQPAEPQATAPQQREHIVRRGDTLWDLARAYLQNPFLWPTIYEANRNVVKDPHWIYPAERLIIPPVLRQAAAPPAPAADAAATPGLNRASYTFEPTLLGNTVAQRDTPASVISSIELRRQAVTAHEYLSAPWLAAQPAAATTGRITAKEDPASSGERMMPTLMPQQRVVVAMAGAAPAVGDSLLIVRAGTRVGTAGTVVQPMGILRVESVAGGSVVGRVITQFGDARVGDPVMALPAVPALPFGSPAPVQGGAAGELLRFVDRGNLHGTTDLAFLSVGRAQGVGIGDELSVYVPAGATSPAVQLAVVRVVRADESSSTARVVSVSSTGLREGLPVSLIRKMP